MRSVVTLSNAAMRVLTTMIYLLTFYVTFLASVALVAADDCYAHLITNNSLDIQNHNTVPAQRVGGAAIALGVLIAWVMAAPDVSDILGPMLIAGIPALIFGLAEDISQKIGVLTRLFATLFSGAIAWYLTGVVVQNTGVPMLDGLLSDMPIAVVFTVFVIGGFTNAVNLIDGFNGLAAGSVAIMLSAVGLIALNEGDSPLASVCFVVAVCALGFGAVNWPLGKLFLGDGGAYFLGFLLAWVAILLPMRNPKVNALATLLVCVYPVLEVGFSVRRRLRRVGYHLWQPDKVHLHHLIHRRVICHLIPNAGETVKNSFTSTICWLFVVLTAPWAVLFYRNTHILIAAIGVAIFIYFSLYARLVQFHWFFVNTQRK